MFAQLVESYRQKSAKKRSLVLPISNTRDDAFRFQGGPARAVDVQWRFELTGDGVGELRIVFNSYFEGPERRGEAVPPPPPPMRMTRDPMGS